MSKKTITPYLPFYMGAPAVTTKSTYENAQVGTLDTINLSDNEVCIMHPEGYYLCAPEEVMLYLRPMGNISQPEIEQLLVIIFDHPGVEPDTRVTIEEISYETHLTETKRLRIDLSVRCWEGFAILDENGNVFLYEDEDKGIEFANQAEVVAFLCRQHFDVFGLRSAGLALDKATLPVETVDLGTLETE